MLARASFVSCLALLAACGGVSADGPLTVSLGRPRGELPATLRAFEFCVGDGATTSESREVFPRCDRPGVELGRAWVVAHYAVDGRVTRLERFEAYDDPARGDERFNQLVERRSTRGGGPSEAAKRALSALHRLPPGTRSWVAFEGDGGALVGLYRLDPVPPHRASVLEELIEPAAP